MFTIELSSATTRKDSTALDCADLLVDDRIHVKAKTEDGVTLIEATIEVEDR